MEATNTQNPKEDEDNKEEVIKRIKDLPPKDRVKAAALNFYLEKKKDMDKQLEDKTEQHQNEFDLKCIPFYTSQNVLALGSKAFTEAELETIVKYTTDLSDEDRQKPNEPLPQYWFKIVQQFFSHESNKSLIGEKDMDLFKSLKQVDLELYQGKNDFQLHFTFEENEFFTNTVLSKRLIYSDDKELADQPIRSEGTVIHWKDESKNVTMKSVTKVYQKLTNPPPSQQKQKNKKTGASRSVKKVVKADSFFNLFLSVQADEDNEETQEQMDKDFDLAQSFVESILPNQLELFLGMDVQDDDEEDFEDMDGEEDEHDDDDDEDSDDDEKKKKKGGKKQPHKKSGDNTGKDTKDSKDTKEPKGDKAVNADCKQQ